MKVVHCELLSSRITPVETSIFCPPNCGSPVSELLDYGHIYQTMRASFQTTSDNSIRLVYGDTARITLSTLNFLFNSIHKLDLTPKALCPLHSATYASVFDSPTAQHMASFVDGRLTPKEHKRKAVLR
ncbi:hypothetical protein STEG23_032866, partial [Scotinomys teguina]